MTRISVVSSWLCSTGVAVISSYCILTGHSNTPAEQKAAAEVAARISKRGWIPEYKPQDRHSSATKKTTIAKVTAKDDKPSLNFPEAYRKVAVGGVAMGDVLNCLDYWTHRKWIGGSDQWKVDEVSLGQYKRLSEPEFYCTKVWYSTLPATRQVDSIRMHGDLEIGNTSKAYKMANEVSKWMKEDFGAVDQKVATPAGAVAFKKFKIGKGMDVEVKIAWNQQRTVENGDAHIDITFTAGELVEESLQQRQELGVATDEERVKIRYNTGVNYYTVRPKVKADQVGKRVAY